MRKDMQSYERVRIDQPILLVSSGQQPKVWMTACKQTYTLSSLSNSSLTLKQKYICEKQFKEYQQLIF